MLTTEEINNAISEWTSINEPVGLYLGYPKCCIDAFCKQPPLLFKHVSPTESDSLRYKAGCVGGRFTGFIPCHNHALKINAGEIKIEELIKGRDKKAGVFPFY